MSKVPFLIETGGFIPTCDHAVPPDVSLENYQYYLELIHKVAEGI
jgi:uroporphyrinogen decarboxylase